MLPPPEAHAPLPAEGLPAAPRRRWQVPRLLWNRYFLTGSAFVVWMLLFDRNDMLTQARVVQQRHSLETKVAWHRAEVAHLQQQRQALMHSGEALERFARERYKMKRDDEDLFLIVHRKTTGEQD